MKTALLALGLAAMTLSSHTPPTQAPEPEQMILMVTPRWESIKGTLRTYEKVRGQWQPVQKPIDAVVGKKGMGWGRGVFSPEDVQNNTYRQEGDKRAPAGIFSLGKVFGHAPTAQAQQKLGLKMPYYPLTDDTRCVGAGESRYYNMMIEKSQVTPDWKNPKSNEFMRLDAVDPDGVYRWGLFVNHNSDLNPEGMKRNTTAGSCIFLHVWKAPGVGTSGCTAMKKKPAKWLVHAAKASPCFSIMPPARCAARSIQVR